MKRSASPVLACVVGLLAVPLASAHGIWFAQRATQTALVYGVGADDLDMVRRQPLVESVIGLDDELKPLPASLRVAGPLLMVDAEGDALVLGATMFNGIWSKRPNGEWVKKGRDEVPDAVIAEKNYKYAVQLRGPLPRPLPPIPGHRLQIVPQGPVPELLDQPLTLKVLFDGKPVAGARVLRDYVNDPDTPPLRTDANGNVTIRVRNQGHNVVTAIHDGPSDEPTKADKMEHLATLAFTLPHLPE